MSDFPGAAEFDEPPPRLIDSHCHLADPALEPEALEIVDRARAAGVGHVVVIGENPEAARRGLALARKDRTGSLSATAGLHPHEASRWSPKLADWLEQALGDPWVVAAGEMGLDYHYDHSPREAQREAFEAQMDLAGRAGKPAVIHSRDADQDMVAVLANHPKTVAIMHSFTGGSELLRTAVGLGHYVSWSGMITFKNWHREENLLATPLDRLLIETDAPYLAPVPHRGTRNEPAFLVETARRLGLIVGKSLEEIGAITSRNAVRVFGKRVKGIGNWELGNGN
jgi:TatD DNase family protein